ncbi:hypothetical protein [Microcoleus anatoxicus]|uniref:Uncharacterized protein n=1 Tax=Microcoleus anatoxicus PTRS2 TaxID=2705321 RepID=A0ABU8YHU9_9CYAN
MHKLLYFATIGLLAFSIGGCGDGGGGNTASPSPTPGGASPSAASSTPGTQNFPSPVVAAQPPGLIRSTNPDQRAQQSATGIGDNKSQPKNPPAPGGPIPSGALTPNPAQIDPFGPLPPIALQNPAGANVEVGQIANPFPKLPQRQVALLPKLPESSPPPKIEPIAPTASRNNSPRSGQSSTRIVTSSQTDPSQSGGNGTQIGSPRQIQGLNTPQFGRRPGQPGLPGGVGTQIGSTRQIPGLNAPQLGSRPGQPGLPGGVGTQIGSPRQIPGLNTPQFGSRPGQPGLPGGEGAQVGSPRPVPGINTPQLGTRLNPATTTGRNPRRPATLRAPQPIAATPLGVPNLPALPVDKRPPQWRAPNPIARRVTSTPSRPAPPRPPQPIAARPLGVPNLPPLPVDKRPPQWIDPNPPPVKQVPAIPAPPPPPSTDLATGTEVSGVVKVGSETQVIVRVPNEPTSRYVKVGQRLSNGQVLVKRVDVKSGADPIVILEENGVEVAKAVGEKPPSREQKPANAVIGSLPNPNRATGR